MPTDWLNYHHLHYFWLTAREGSLTQAAARLRLAVSTVSSQIKVLEDHLGTPLFERVGRRLVLTPTGRMVAEYADDIFALGQELTEAVRHGGSGNRPLQLRVGAVSILDKRLVYRLLSPAVHLPDLKVQLRCIEDRPDALVAELALHHLDLVLTDAPIGLARDLRAVSHNLGECGISVLGTPALAARFGEGFPASLHGAPILLPVEGSTVRSELERWLDRRAIVPEVVAELSDSALMKAFGAEGAGLFLVPELIAADVVAAYGVQSLGTLDGLSERFYALTMARRLEHPAVAAIVAAAEDQLAG